MLHIYRDPFAESGIENPIYGYRYIKSLKNELLLFFFR